MSLNSNLKSLQTGTLSELNSKLADLKAADIEVVAASADPVDVTIPFVADRNLLFPVACGLSEANMRSLGLYVSDPKDYQPQKFRFSEPGYYFLSRDNTIKYVCIASHPMGGRINVDALLAGVNWSETEVKSNPSFQNVVWGSK